MNITKYLCEYKTLLDSCHAGFKENVQIYIHIIKSSAI